MQETGYAVQKTANNDESETFARRGTSIMGAEAGEFPLLFARLPQSRMQLPQTFNPNS
jgi:hypothetical protein